MVQIRSGQVRSGQSLGLVKGHVPIKNEEFVNEKKSERENGVNGCWATETVVAVQHSNVGSSALPAIQQTGIRPGKQP